MIDSFSERFMRSVRKIAGADLAGNKKALSVSLKALGWNMGLEPTTS